MQDNPSATPLRLLQHQFCLDQGRRLELARWLVATKIGSQANATRHYQRHGCSIAGEALHDLRQLEEQAGTAQSLAQVRGIEGAAAAAWFGIFGQLLRPPWVFPGRVRRPPTDPVNALLSLGYTLLLTRAGTRCQAIGLELHLGTLHAYRPGRPSLACDLIEPLRVPAVDRWVVELCNEGRATPDMLVRGDDQGMRLRPAAMGRILGEWEDRWLNHGQEAALNALLGDVVRRFREQVVSPMSPLGEVEDLDENIS